MKYIKNLIDRFLEWSLQKYEDKLMRKKDD